jgi:hypothetical protein
MFCLWHAINVERTVDPFATERRGPDATYFAQAA